MKRSIEQLSISKHAHKRMAQRHIELSEKELSKLNEAASRLKKKGSRESLIISPLGAFILDLEHYCLITVVSPNEMTESIFTQIDSTMIVN